MDDLELCNAHEQAPRVASRHSMEGTYFFVSSFFSPFSFLPQYIILFIGYSFFSIQLPVASYLFITSLYRMGSNPVGYPKLLPRCPFIPNVSSKSRSLGFIPTQTRTREMVVREICYIWKKSQLLRGQLSKYDHLTARVVTEN